MARFTVHAPSAHRVALDLIGPVSDRIDMVRDARGSFHVDVPAITPGQRYGFRCWGPSHNPAKLILDPRARAIAGYLEWHPATAHADPRDSAPYVPHSVWVPPVPAPQWQRPHHATQDLVVYEAHVKGLTRLHPAVPEALRGTYAGLAHPAVIDHLTTLGVTAIELLPVHAHISEPHLLPSGRTNYWGYSTVGFFAPHNAYTACARPEDGPAEFRAMVRALHEAGIEVWLDVVYNHTGEGGTNGPSLCFRGLGESDWYRSQDGTLVDYTGCGNTLDVRKAHVQDLIVDSLRYWAEHMGVDGFRFDLAVSLGRRSPHFDPHHPLLERIGSDPILRERRLVAEPWDLGPQGYAVGLFPPPWMEWNGQYRDVVRDVWRGQPVIAEHIAASVVGTTAAPLPHGHDLARSITFITCHDGFTLADLVAYERKHNHANGEDNRDGSNDNRSSNSGAEGPTDDPDVLERRQRRQRALLLTLFASHGTPMLLAGDELGHSQGGNNNAYCQDNRLSWLDWHAADPELLHFTHRALAARQALPALRSAGERPPLLIGDSDAVVLHLRPAQDDAVVLVLNPDVEECPVTLPDGAWSVVIASTEPVHHDGLQARIPGLSVVVFAPR